MNERTRVRTAATELTNEIHVWVVRAEPVPPATRAVK
jgi:hypothetical protein